MNLSGRMKNLGAYLLIFFLLPMLSLAQPRSVISDEQAVPDYKLPGLLSGFNGRKINTPSKWVKKRRPEILNAFAQEVYGKVPGELKISEVEIWEQSNDALGGLAIRKQVSLVFRKDSRNLELNLLIYLPKANEKVPVFLAYNFAGNHSVSGDPNIRLTESWVANDPSVGIINNRVTEQSRGVHAEQWPVNFILKAGYGFATAYYGDLDADKDDFTDGIQPFFYRSGQQNPGSFEWGSIAVWAWGLSRILDYLETDPLVDAGKIAIVGQAQTGKAVLWAGANDERFGMVIANESGGGGAAILRRQFGQNVNLMVRNHPNWFSENFNKYAGKEDYLPVDQHMLLALMAPRSLYVSSVVGDRWSDPRGEFLSAKYASDVYQLLGNEGLPAKEMPKLYQPVVGTIAYHVRTGKKELTFYDWQQYIQFANLFFRK